MRKPFWKNEDGTIVVMWSMLLPPFLFCFMVAADIVTMNSAAKRIDVAIEESFFLVKIQMTDTQMEVFQNRISQSKAYEKLEDAATTQMILHLSKIPSVKSYDVAFDVKAHKRGMSVEPKFKIEVKTLVAHLADANWITSEKKRSRKDGKSNGYNNK